MPRYIVGVPATTVRKRIQTVALLGPAAALAVLASANNMSTTAAVLCMTTALAFKSLGMGDHANFRYDDVTWDSIVL